ncbi:outer membrane protein assembly factor BamE [Leptospira ainazelensis]|uniref:outer membrane protein assembly factor BamE n=1 Tax=Leptospira ainazelensis TaxID=2810034 RepID=UPI001E3CFF53|nr:outer membrane protein assembly factor BamE [Leptospira ainazelensis]
MSTVLGFLTLGMFGSLIIGLIKPELVVKGNLEKTRKTVIKYFGTLTVILLIIYGMTGGGRRNNSTSGAMGENGTITKENCQAVKNGMNKEEVTALLGETQSQSENTLGGYGTTELWHFQDTSLTAAASGKIEACDVYFTNGKVSSKAWTKL